MRSTRFIAVLWAQHRAWPRAGGWAPSNAAVLLEAAKLDRQLSFAHTLRDIDFYLKTGDDKFGPFLKRVQERGNAIHHFGERPIGTQDELKADIVLLRDFIVSIDLQLPDPPPLPDPDW